MLLLVLIMATALLMSFGTTSPRYSIMQAMYFPGNWNHNFTYGFNLSAVKHGGAIEFMTFSEKMPKIDTLDALEEREEHEDDHQTNSN